MSHESMYTERDRQRFLPNPISNKESYRTEWRRDAARVIHSSAFRRLQGKTQLYPVKESDFFRNRLTHSLEVGQIAKSIAIRLNETEEFLRSPEMKIEPDICEIAGWVHDIGHPPYGHNGEEALDALMRDHGGFEGNAQTFRILSRLEKKEKAHNADKHGSDDDGNDLRYGLNLTFRTLAATLKYNSPIPLDRPLKPYNGPVKGYYTDDADRVHGIKDAVLGSASSRADFKTIECSIMDIADDIAYSTYDLEDSFKAGFLTPLDLVNPPSEILTKVAAKITERSGITFSPLDAQQVLEAIFGQIIGDNDVDTPLQRLQEASGSSKELANDAFIRNRFTSELVGRFINGVKFDPDDDLPCLSKVRLGDAVYFEIEVLKNYMFYSRIMSPDLQIIAQRGKEIVEKIMTRISVDPQSILPGDFSALCGRLRKVSTKRIVCDFIAGMTDRYASEYFGRLFSENPQSLFKPL